MWLDPPWCHKFKDFLAKVARIKPYLVYVFSHVNFLHTNRRIHYYEYHHCYSNQVVCTRQTKWCAPLQKGLARTLFCSREVRVNPCLLSSSKSRPHLSTYVDPIKGGKRAVLRSSRVIMNLTKGC